MKAAKGWGVHKLLMRKICIKLANDTINRLIRQTLIKIMEALSSRQKSERSIVNTRKVANILVR